MSTYVSWTCELQYFLCLRRTKPMGKVIRTHMNTKSKPGSKSAIHLSLAALQGVGRW
ncbi:hypothetical protein M404DRAFT_233065 [Pisolithus tinctorius Marx 270]|uniref:Uncharacterized protein n=1 Tax=Pisolithus tinctorius Marx 270 TaxID=870435 RepID=A0A0C3JLU5_PISTI|nr:hypothetical protein M404DRAFT_233065 [Pisolithus tinctorius Marx 270]